MTTIYCYFIRNAFTYLPVCIYKLEISVKQATILKCYSFYYNFINSSFIHHVKKKSGYLYQLWETVPVSCCLFQDFWSFTTKIVLFISWQLTLSMLISFPIFYLPSLHRKKWQWPRPNFKLHDQINLTTCTPAYLHL